MIKKDCLNSTIFDRTSWYAFTEYGEYLMKEAVKADKVISFLSGEHEKTEQGII